MRFKLFPYKQGSKSARLIARGLNVLRVRPTYDPKRRDIIINWGNSYTPQWIRAEHDLNKPEAIALACNKLHTFKHLSEQGFTALPEWTTDKDVAKQWLAEDFKIYCRTLLTSHSGRGIVVASNESELVTAPLYTKQTKHKDEFRIHVFKGKAIDATIKRRRRGMALSSNIRNHSSGWVFCREDCNPPESLVQCSIEAVNKLGLDFGAVDIGYNYYHERPTLFEVNTAPGIEGTTLSKYINSFKEYLNEVHSV